MKRLSVCKADPIGITLVEGATIEIGGNLPEDRKDSFYEDEALKIVEGLLQLPQATLERVLRLLLEKYAGSFRGPVTPTKENAK